MLLISAENLQKAFKAFTYPKKAQKFVLFIEDFNVDIKMGVFPFANVGNGILWHVFVFKVPAHLAFKQLYHQPVRHILNSLVLAGDKKCQVEFLFQPVEHRDSFFFIQFGFVHQLYQLCGLAQRLGGMERFHQLTGDQCKCGRERLLLRTALFGHNLGNTKMHQSDDSDSHNQKQQQNTAMQCSEGFHS